MINPKLETSRSTIKGPENKQKPSLKDAPQILVYYQPKNPKPKNPKPQTPNPKPQTPNPKPQTLNRYILRGTSLHPFTLRVEGPERDQMVRPDHGGIARTLRSPIGGRTFPTTHGRSPYTPSPKTQTPQPYPQPPELNKEPLNPKP